MSDGIRSGVNWMRLKLRFSAVGQRADHQRLGQARHADEQAVAAGEDGDQQLFDDPLLADDRLAQFLEDAAIAVVEPFDGRQVALDARKPSCGGAAGAGRQAAAVRAGCGAGDDSIGISTGTAFRARYRGRR